MLVSVILAVLAGCAVSYLITGHITGAAISINILVAIAAVLIAMWRSTR